MENQPKATSANISASDQPPSISQPILNPSDAPVQTLQHSKRNYWKISIVLFAVVFVCAASVYLMTTLARNAAQNTSAIPSESPSISSKEGQQDVMPVKQSSGKLAYRMGGTVLEGGDIWTSNADGSGKQKLTNSSRIGWVYSWSPDNRYILASTIENDGPNFIKTAYIVVDSQTGAETNTEITRGPSGRGNSDFVWTSNNQITFLDEGVLYREILGSGITEVWRVPKEIEANYYHLDRSANRVAYDTSGPDIPATETNIYSYDIQKNQKNTVTSDGGAYLLGWMGDLIFYQQNQSLWTSTFDGKTKKKLVDLGEWFVKMTSVSTDGSKIFYSADNRKVGSTSQEKLFVYDNKTGITITLSNLEENTFAGNLSISSDESFGAYTLLGIVHAPSLIVNFADSKNNKLCESACYYPVWQN